MPNSAWMDDLVNLLKPEDPANVASAFAGMRGSVPIYAALYSKDASGPQELAFEARNNAQSQAQRDAQYAALQKKQGLAAIPDEALRKAVAARMSEEERYPPALATRRADFAPQPRHEMRQYAEGGAVRPDFTQPDMADGGAFIPDQEYQKGGGVKKSLQQMAEELFSKGVKTADTPDLARRSLFGLKAQPKLDLPLARMDDIQKDLAKAPAITEKSVTIDPGQGAAKSTLKSLTETPMSRRAVMQTAAGQVLRHTIPGLNEALPTPDILGEIGKIVDVAKPMAAAPAFTNPIAIIMHMRKNGASEEEIAKALGVPNPGSMAPTAQPTHGPRLQEEINASKDFMFRDPEARAILEKVSGGDIIKFAQLGMDKPNALPYDWQLKRWLENGELDERMRAWLATKGEHTFMPKDFAQPVDQGRAVRDRVAFQTMYDDVVNPSNYLRGTTPTLKTPSRAFQEITGLGVDTDAPLISMRDELRQIRAADPEQYKTIKNAARDVSMDSAETARAMGLPARKVEKVLKGEISTDDLPNWYKFHQDFEYAGGGKVSGPDLKAKVAEWKPSTEWSFDAQNPYVGTNIKLADGQIVPYDAIVQQVLKRYDENYKNPTLAVKSGISLGIPDEVLLTLPGVDETALAAGHELIDSGAFGSSAVNEAESVAAPAPIGTNIYGARIAAGLDAYGYPPQQVEELRQAGQYIDPNVDQIKGAIAASQEQGFTNDQILQGALANFGVDVSNYMPESPPSPASAPGLSTLANYGAATTEPEPPPIATPMPVPTRIASRKMMDFSDQPDALT